MGKISKALNNIADALESIANASNNKQEETTPPVVTTQKNQTPTVTSTGYQGLSIYSVHRDFDKYSQEYIIDRIYKVINTNGDNLKYNNPIMEELKKNWPELHKELIFLMSYKKRLILENKLR
jgi:hypothetical protein